MKLELSVNIGEIAETIRGVTYEKAQARSSPREGYSPLIRATNIDHGALVLDSFVYVPDAVIRDEQRLRVGDIVLAASSGSLSVVGKAALLRSQWHGTFGAFCYAVRPQPERVVPDYLAYFMQTSAYRNRVSKLAAGVNINNLRREHIESVDLPYFALSKQRRIVEAVDSYLTRLDDAVASLERVQAKLKAYRASVLKAAVEGRLVPNEASIARAENRDYEPAEALLARILKERRRRREDAELAKIKAAGKTPENDGWKSKYEVPLAPDKSELPEIADGWCWATIDQIAECLDHLRVPISKQARQNRKGTVPYYGANGQAGWIDRPLFDEALVLVVEDETFTGRTKPFSYLIEGPSWVNNHAHVLRALGAVSPQFLNASLAHYPFIPLTTGTTGRRKLTKRALMAAALPIPPHEEQERIMEIVDSIVSVSDNATITVAHQLARSQRLRQAVLKWAFEGKLVDQDPSDEPANKMLARIRAGRTVVAPAKKNRGRAAEGVA